MWGTLGKDAWFDNGDRFIPTHVGNSIEVRDTRRYDTVHPHACGELFIDYYEATGYGGSSPRMWGTL